MSIKVEKTDKKNELKLEFKIEAEKFNEGIKKVYKKSASYFNIPGFRKGKAPLQIVEKHYGEDIFYQDAFNEIVPVIYDAEIKENNIEAVSAPQIDIVQMGKDKELIFTAVVQTKPEVVLGKYKGIELKKVEYTVSDEDIEKELNQMAERNSRLVSVEDRAVQDGDTTIIDFAGSIDGIAFDGGTAKGHELVIGSHTFIEGFEDQLIGMKLGEEKDVNVLFPKEYFSQDLAGKPAVFKVKLNEIKQKELPEIDDEFAKDVSEFDNLKDLKGSIKEKLTDENNNRAKYETEEEAIKLVCDAVELEIPSGMIETETDNMVKDIEARLGYQGMNLEKYLELVGKTETEFRKEYEEQANKSVKTKLVLDAVFVDAKLEITEADMKLKIEEMAKNYSKEVKDIENNENMKKYIETMLKTEKAINYLVDSAKIK